MNWQSGSKNYPGAVAQLGERVNGIHEVEGSIPFSSTKAAAKPGLLFIFWENVCTISFSPISFMKGINYYG